MAEYREVMKHLKRMCEYYEQCGPDCPLYVRADGEVRICGCSASVNTLVGMHTQCDVTESKVMKWAAEHPEYPTWMELLLHMGVAETDGNGFDTIHRLSGKVYEMITEKDAKSIGLDLSEVWRNGEWVK